MVGRRITPTKHLARANPVEWLSRRQETSIEGYPGVLSVADRVSARNERVGQFAGSSEIDPTYGFKNGYHTLKEEGP